MKTIREIVTYLLVFISIAIILYCISGCSNSYEEYTVKSNGTYIETIRFNFGQGQVVVKEYTAPNGKTFYIFKSLSSGDIDVISAD